MITVDCDCKANVPTTVHRHERERTIAIRPSCATRQSEKTVEVCVMPEIMVMRSVCELRMQSKARKKHLKLFDSVGGNG